MCEREFPLFPHCAQSAIYICTSMRKFTLIWIKFREISCKIGTNLVLNTLNAHSIFCEFTQKCLHKSQILVSLSRTVWKNGKFSLTEIFFRQINSLVISFIKMLFSRNFYKKGWEQITLISTPAKIRVLLFLGRNATCISAFYYILLRMGTFSQLFS